MIPRRLALFERRVMLFIDHNQSEIGRRRKNSAASPDNDLHLTASNLLPMPMPLRIRQMRMQNRHLAEPRLEPRPRLRRQANLRHQHNRLPSITNHFIDRADVNLSLATAGDAMHEDRLMPP